MKSRFPLGDFFVKQNHFVFYACPRPEKKNNVFDLNIGRNIKSPFVLIKGIFNLKRIESQKDIDTILSFRLSSNLLNYFSSFFGLKKNRIAVITGLGYSFVYGGIKFKVLKYFISLFYKYASKRLTIIAQNPDDLNDLNIKNGLVILGSGIKEPKNRVFIKKNKSSLNLLFVGRLLKSKGIKVALDIFNKLRQSNKKIKLTIAGSVDNSNPDSISDKYLQKIKNIEGIDYFGYVNDLEKLYLNSDILIFPSTYREGVPRTIIEAMSYGLTIITTDKPGCKETISSNGILIKNNSIEEAINYIESLSNDDLEANSNKSIEIFKKKFSQKKIFPQYLKILLNNKF